MDLFGQGIIERAIRMIGSSQLSSLIIEERESIYIVDYILSSGEKDIFTMEKSKKPIKTSYVSCQCSPAA